MPDGQAEEATIELPDDGSAFIVGSGVGVDFVIDDPTVGTRQFSLHITGDQILINNLDDEWGTLFNSNELDSETPIHAGDEIEAGSVRIVIRSCRVGQSSAAVDAAPAVEPEPEVELSTVDPGIPEPPVQESIEPEPEPKPEPEPEPDPWASSAPDPVQAVEPPPAPVQSESSVTEVDDEPWQEDIAEDEAFQSPAPQSQLSGNFGEYTELIERLMAEFSARISSYNSSQLEALLETIPSTASLHRLETPEQIELFAECVVLLGDSLQSKDSAFSEVYFTLAHPRKSARDRLDRALRLAREKARTLGDAPNTSTAPGQAGAQGLSKAQSTQPKSPPPPPPPPASTPPPTVSISQSSAPSALTNAVDDETSTEPPASQTVSEPNSPPTPAQTLSAAATVSVERGSTHDTRQTAPPMDQPEMSPEAVQIETELEGYEIRNKIGSGGMGTVYQAHDINLDVDVAIKVIRSVHPEAQEQLQKEAQAAARIQHPNIVQVMRFVQAGTGGYSVMQLIRGANARELISRFAQADAQTLTGDQLTELAELNRSTMVANLREVLSNKEPYFRMIAWWLAGVADGLDHAHREHVIHRDIKPSNLLLAPDGRMMIADFGLATRLSDASGMEPARVGTPRYLSPERVADWAVRSTQTLGDCRVDIWSLGITMYELLALRSPWDGDSESVIHQIVTTDPPAPSAYCWQVPRELEQICRRAMLRDPEGRYQHAKDLADDLRTWLAGQPLPIRQSSSVSVWSWLGGKAAGKGRQER